MKDKRMTNTQYLGALVLIFVLGFGAYTTGYKHGEEKLWGDIWSHHEKEIRYYYGHNPCNTPTWKKEGNLEKLIKKIK